MGVERHRMSDDRDSGSSLGDRMLAGFLSLLFSLPAAGLLWFLFNTRLGLSTRWFIPGSWLVLGILAVAGIAFVVPRAMPTMVGKLWSFLLWVGKGW